MKMSNYFSEKVNTLRVELNNHDLALKTVAQILLHVHSTSRPVQESLYTPVQDINAISPLRQQTYLRGIGWINVEISGISIT